MEQDINKKDIIPAQPSAEIYKLIFFSEFPHDLDKIDPQDLKPKPNLGLDDYAYDKAMYKTLPLAALKLNKFLDNFKSLMLVNKETYERFKDFIHNHILNIHPLVKNRILLLCRVDISILKSILLTTKLTDLPVELIGIITNMAADYDLTDNKDIIGPHSFQCALYTIAKIHSTNRLFYSNRQNSIDNLAEKLKLKKWDDKISRKFFDYMLSKKKFPEEAYFLLIESGAKINTYDSKLRHIDIRILLKAISKNYNQLAKRIISGNSIEDKSFILEHAVKKGNVGIVKLMLELGADANLSSISENPPLFLALKNGNFEIADLLIQHGANINAKCKLGLKGPMLYLFSSPAWIVHDPNNERLIWLLDNGADINNTGQYGYTPMMQASCRGNIPTVKLLLDRGAKIDIKGSDGNTALSLASNGIIKKMIKEKKKSKRCLIS